MVRLQFKCFGLLLSSLWGQLAKKVEFKTFAKCPTWKFPAFSGICKGVSVYTPRPHIIHRFGEWAVVAGRSGFKGQVLKLGSSSLCLVYLGKSVLIYYSFSFRVTVSYLTMYFEVWGYKIGNFISLCFTWLFFFNSVSVSLSIHI